MRAEFLTALQLSLSTRDGEPFFTLTRHLGLIQPAETSGTGRARLFRYSFQPRKQVRKGWAAHPMLYTGTPQGIREARWPDIATQAIVELVTDYLAGLRLEIDQARRPGEGTGLGEDALMGCRRDKRACRRRTMSRCQRKIVPGVTISRIAARRSAGTVPASSASHARSGHVKRE